MYTLIKNRAFGAQVKSELLVRLRDFLRSPETKQLYLFAYFCLVPGLLNDKRLEEERLLYETYFFLESR